MKVYIDCDVAVKLAKWGLLKRFALHLSKQGKAQLYTVKTLRFKFKLQDPSKAVSLLGSADAVQQLIDFVAVCQEAKGQDQAVAMALVDVPSIDAGEAALFAAAAQFDAVLVDTGDKNAIRALGALGNANPAVKALQSKIACLEQSVGYMVERWTFATVNAAIKTCEAADKATATCFAGNDEALAFQALGGRIQALSEVSAGVLSAEPFSWVP